MDLDVWASCIILSKWLVYIGAAASVGGPFVAAGLLRGNQWRQLRTAVTVYVLLGASTGLAATMVNFFLQVGAFAEDGLHGIVDKGIMVLLWQSSVGDALIWRGLGFAAALITAISILSSRQKRSAPSLGLAQLIGYAVGACILCFTFSIIGHSAEVGTTARTLLVIHVVGATWWVGSLIPLWLVCRAMPIAELRELMHRFGRQAAVLVGGLLVCGSALLLMLVESPVDMLATPYGLAMSTKLAGVFAMLGLAALHKWQFVPRLNGPVAVQRLQSSILIESLLAALILLATAVLSSVLGPVGMA